VRFRLIAPDDLAAQARAAGFEPERCWGGYDRAPWDPATSPAWLCELRSREA
jgi:hypothetical protein